ncbi:MAG: MBL fold metallo-hydrolase [Clostridium sp.]|nr:MBL fold metallo-hydrolase [Clostridium sp.]
MTGERKMAEEIYRNIWRIGVELPGNPLRELNSYLLKGKDSWLLIDTGFRKDACRNALRKGLEEVGADTEKTDVLLTHLHSDHSGLSAEFAGKNRKIYLSRTDLRYLGMNIANKTVAERNARFLEEGFPKELLEENQKTNPAMAERLLALDDRFTPIDDGQELTIGEYTLKTVVVPGHTPGNTMFWMPEQEIMFTGDHILFDITPNITAWSWVEDSLGDYLENLLRVRNYPVKLALPGHRKSGDYKERIRVLLDHHARRLGETERIILQNPGLCAYEIAGLMTWKIRSATWAEFPLAQKWFAVGECMSHLNYLVKRGRAERRTADGIRRYYAGSASGAERSRD